MTKPKEYQSFGEIKERLDQIVEAVSDDTMPLDDALSLYEEAVKLGLRAKSLIEAQDAQASAEETPSTSEEEAAPLEDAQ